MASLDPDSDAAKYIHVKLLKSRERGGELKSRSWGVPLPRDFLFFLAWQVEADILSGEGRRPLTGGPSMMNDTVMDQRTDRALFVWLLLAGWFGVLAGLPWTLAVLRDYPGTGWWWEAAGDFLFFIPASAAAGVWLGKKVGLGSGLRELVSRAPGCWKQVRVALVPGALVGLALGGLGLISQNAMPKDVLIPALNNPNTFERLLRCLSAALTEEIAFRFGLMSLFAWIIWSILKRPALHAPSLWMGNLLSALVFAAAHFPQLELQRYGLSLLVPFVISSSGTGMIMGWLYMRYGLVSAIAAHLVTDLMIYVVPRVGAMIL